MATLSLTRSEKGHVAWGKVLGPENKEWPLEILQWPLEVIPENSIIQCALLLPKQVLQADGLVLKCHKKIHVKRLA